jgi:hypothetical protein
MAIPRWRVISTLIKSRWAPPETRLHKLENALRESDGVVRRGGDHDPWDLEVQGGLMGGVRMILALEHHGASHQLLRVRMWPTVSPIALTGVAILAALSTAAGLSGAVAASVVLATLATAMAGRLLWEAAHAAGTLLSALPALRGEDA